LVLGTLDDIDTLLLARLKKDSLLLMPHGGEAIVRAVVECLQTMGCRIETTQTPLDAADPVEAAMLRVLPSAPTTLAIDLLLAQPRRWHTFQRDWTDEDEARSHRLNRLLRPPLVAMAGPPNIGKSTLLNALAGRQAAMVHDTPGTTRDHVGVHLDLAGLVVEWLDLPGLRASSDAVETKAIRLAEARLAEVDLCIGAADATSDWPDPGRAIDLRVGLRRDLGTRDDADVSCAALHGDGLDDLVRVIRSTLVWDADLASERPWRFPGLSVPN
jgi:tRNA modification GTPase